MNQLRTWITTTLKNQIAAGYTIWSDTHPGLFQRLTGVRQKDLEAYWYKLDAKGHPDKSTVGPKPGFTTCSSFLPVFAIRIREAGGLPTTKRNPFSGKVSDIIFRGFDLASERGWVSAPEGDAKGGPQPGDFFQLANGGATVHVGVIVEIQGSLWGCVAGGAGGRTAMHDGVKRTLLQPRPGNVMGWINVDVYFEGWTDPSNIYDDL